MIIATNLQPEGDPLASCFVDIVSLPWIEAGPDNEMKELMHDAETGIITILTRLEPGASIPPHVHEAMFTKPWNRPIFWKAPLMTTRVNVRLAILSSARKAANMLRWPQTAAPRWCFFETNQRPAQKA